MKEVGVSVMEGPLSGQRQALRLGKVVLGREPGPDGFKLVGDLGVSREHGELRVEGQRVLYRNLSANHTAVDGVEVQGEIELRPGSALRIGQHLVKVDFRPALGSVDHPPDSVQAGILKRGVLARPAVRTLVVVYLLIIVGFAFYLGSVREPSVARAFRAVSLDYRAHYRPPGWPLRTVAGELANRTAEAGRLVGELEGMERAERWSEARMVCRQIMDLDRDPASPLFRFAARETARLPPR
jgi:hypothetical protein